MLSVAGRSMLVRRRLVPVPDPSAVISNNGQGHLTLHQLYHNLSESHQNIVNIEQESNKFSYYAPSLAHPIRMIGAFKIVLQNETLSKKGPMYIIMINHNDRLPWLIPRYNLWLRRVLLS